MLSMVKNWFIEEVFCNFLLLTLGQGLDDCERHADVSFAWRGADVSLARRGADTLLVWWHTFLTCLDQRHEHIVKFLSYLDQWYEHIVWFFSCLDQRHEHIVKFLSCLDQRYEHIVWFLSCLDQRHEHIVWCPREIAVQETVLLQQTRSFRHPSCSSCLQPMYKLWHPFQNIHTGVEWYPSSHRKLNKYFSTLYLLSASHRCIK